MTKDKLEPELLKDGPLRNAPTNEVGVIFLFAHLSRRMQLHVERVQAGFPDCIARQRVGGMERLIRIEFEFRSSNYRAHRHPSDGCDWIVCWEHDWDDAPSNIKVVELRQYFGHVFNVWVLVLPARDRWPAIGKYGFKKRVAKGDLILVYEWSPKQWFRQLYAVAGEAEVVAKGEEYGSDARKHSKYHIVESNQPVLYGKYAHPLRRVCTLMQPLTMKTVKADSLIPANFVFTGDSNRKITESWWRVYELIIRKNPECAAILEDFSPSKV